MSQSQGLRPAMRFVAACVTALALFGASELKAQTYWTDPGAYDVSWPWNGQNIKNLYDIWTPAELGAFAAAVSAGNDFTGCIVYLRANLDMSQYEWWPAGLVLTGHSGFHSEVFRGIFDGQGYTIRGLRSKSVNLGFGNTSGANLGLFSILDDGATVRDVNIIDCDIGQEGLMPSGGFVGGVAGEAYNSGIENVVVSGAIGQSADDVGGIVGRALDVTIRNCTVYGSVGRASDNMGALGGIVGYTSFDTVLDNCHNRSDISGNAVNTGGIAGTADYYTGQGIIIIQNCSNTGAITVEEGNSNVVATPTGGLVGFANFCNIMNCWNAGDVIGHSVRGCAKVGGLLGQSNGCTLDNCYSSGTINNDHSDGMAVSGEWIGEVLDNYAYQIASHCFLKLGGPYVGAGWIGQHPQYGNYRFGPPIPNDLEGAEIYYILPYDAWDVSSPVGGFRSKLEWRAWTSGYDWESWTMDDSWERGAKGYPSFGPLQAPPTFGTYWTDDDVRDQSWPAGCYDSNTSTYSIYTPAQLGQFAWMVGQQGFGGETVRIENDLDMSAHLWWPAGADVLNLGDHYAYATITEFQGTFDGGSHTLSGIRFSGSTPLSLPFEDFGLVGALGISGVIRDVRLTGCDIHADAMNLGGIAGTVRGLIESCSVSGVLECVFGAGGGCGVGGIAGVVVNGGNICECTVNATIYGPEFAGGIAAGLSEGIIDRCAVAGRVEGFLGPVGGIAGTVDDGGVFNCDNAATVTGAHTGGFVGGIAGSSGSSASVANCRNSGKLAGVGGGARMGGIIGDCTESSVYNCMSVAEFDMIGHFSHGGIFGVATTYGTPLGPVYWLNDVSGPYPSSVTGIWGATSHSTTSYYFYPGGWLPVWGGYILPALDGNVTGLNYASFVSQYGVAPLPWTLDGSPDGYPILDGLTLPGGDDGDADETWVHIDAIQVSAQSGVILEWDFQPIQTRLGAPSFSYTIETSTDLASWQASVTPPVLSRVGNIERAIVPANGDRMFFRVKAYK